MQLLKWIFVVILLIFFTGKSGMSVDEKKEKPQFTNRLAREKSPYLLQHADNPVDWYPWGEEAFEKARREDKPVFLSVGYSTCHWCHVMEHESFEDPDVAKVMNKYFVSIKVDREERPDLDQIYMNAVMALSGSGGWPMSVFLTPEGKPFYGGTYYPPQPMWGRPSFKQLLEGLADAWQNKREDVLRSAEGITSALTQKAAPAAKGLKLTPEVLENAYAQFENSFDPQHGGFEVAPKFPRAHTLSFLLRYANRSSNPKALQMVEKTLDEMARGGIYDQLGSGFHRYSTDERWHVPHFEKMLYDQAINAKAYLEIYQATRKEDYARVAREVLDYVRGNLTSKEGGFYCATDADSPLPDHPEQEVEGTFFVFERNEIEKLLGTDRAKIFCYAFGVSEDGNAGSGAHGELLNKNVLYAAHSVEETAKESRKKPAEVEKILAESKNILLEYREKRPRPHLDDKILTDWNGLMISTLAFGGRVLKEPRYTAAAQKAADFILAKLRRSDGRLLHRFRDGEVGILGYLEDYAFFIHGLIDLYEATFEPKYLKAAKELTDDMVTHFWDETEGGFFHTAHDAEKLIAHTREIYDGAIPSGNSLALLDLLRVGRLTQNLELERKAEAAFSAFAATLANYPSGYPQMLIAFDFAAGPSKEIVIAGDPTDPATQKMIELIYSKFIPNKVVALRPADDKQAAAIIALVPFLKDSRPLDGKPTAYVCQNYACQLPTTDPAILANQL